MSLELSGGKYNERRPDGKYEEKPQQALIRFLCSEKGDKTEKRDVDDGEGEDHSKFDDRGEEQSDGQNGTIKYISWDVGDKIDTLRLDWTTQYACRGQNSQPEGKSSGHWGFFTWLIIM